MITNPHLLERLHRRHEAERLSRLTFEEALAIYAALWAEARALGLDGAADWENDVKASVAVARTLNGLA